MLGSPAGPGGPSQRGGLWPLAPAPAPPATNFTTSDGFNKYGVYSLFPGGPSLGSAIYSHASTIGRFTSGSIQQQTGGPFHAGHKISDSLFSTGYTFGAPTPPPGSPYSPVPVTQLEFLTKGFNSSNIITIQQQSEYQQQQQQQHQQQHQQQNSPKKIQKFDDDYDEKYCSNCLKQTKYCNCRLTSSPSITKLCTKINNHQGNNNINNNNITTSSSIGGCSRTNPVEWSSVNIKKEPGALVPCQVAEITTSVSPMVKVEVTSPTIHKNTTEANNITPVVTTNGNIPVGIAVARQRIQQHEVVAASPSLPPAGLLTTVNTSTQIKEISRISELDSGMAATAATGGGVHGGGTLLQCADERTSGLGNWPMCGTHNSALTTPTLWQYPAHLPVEPLVPLPVPPVGLQLVRDPNTGHLLLLPTTGIEQTVVWPSYTQPSSHVLFPPIPPPPLQLLSSASSDYLSTSTTLHQHTQTHHSTRLVAVTTDTKRKIPLPIPATTLIKIETDTANLDQTKSLQSVSTLSSNTGTVFTEQNMTPLVTTHVIYQHPTNLILSQQTQPSETTGCRSQGTSPVACLTPPPDTLPNIEDEPLLGVQDASNQTETPICSSSEEEENNANDKKQLIIQKPAIETNVMIETKKLNVENNKSDQKESIRNETKPDLSGLELLSNSIVEYEKNFNNKVDADNKANDKIAYITSKGQEQERRNNEQKGCENEIKPYENQTTRCENEIKQYENQTTQVENESARYRNMNKRENERYENGTKSYESKPRDNVIKQYESTRFLNENVRHENVIHYGNNKIKRYENETLQNENYDDKTKQCDRKTKEYENEVKLFENNTKCFEDKIKFHETKTKSFENETKSFANEIKSFENDRKSFENETKSFENERKCFEIQPKHCENKAKLFENETKHFENETKYFQNETKLYENKRQNETIKSNVSDIGQKNDLIVPDDNCCNLVGLNLLCALAEQRIKEEGCKRNINEEQIETNKRKSNDDINEFKHKKMKYSLNDLENEKKQLKVVEHFQEKTIEKQRIEEKQKSKKLKKHMDHKTIKLLKRAKKELKKESKLNELKLKSQLIKNVLVNQQEHRENATNNKCFCKEENYRSYKTPESELEVRKYLASKSQTLYQNDYYYWPNCMNSIELEMRMQLADIQKKYKETQKELIKLKPKIKQKNRARNYNNNKKITSTINNEKINNCITINSTINSPPISTKTPPPPILDKMDELPPTIKYNKNTQDLLLKPPTLLRVNYDVKEEDKLIEKSSSKKRKVGRPKKLINKQGLSIVTETIVAKKPKKTNIVGYLLAAKEKLLQDRLYSNAANNSPPRYPEETIKITTTKQHHNKTKHNHKKQYVNNNNNINNNKKSKDKCKIRPKLKAEPTIKTYVEEDEINEDDSDNNEDEIEYEEYSKVKNRNKKKEIRIKLKGNVVKDFHETNIDDEDEGLEDNEEEIDEIVEEFDVNEEFENEEELEENNEQIAEEVDDFIEEVEEESKKRRKSHGKVYENLIKENLPINDSEKEDIQEKVENVIQEEVTHEENDVQEDDEEPEEEELKKNDTRCTLTSHHLEIDKLRVLTAMGGLFYAGHLNAVEPPDVYSITLDGERGNRPHIMSREEILRDAIVEVSPTSTQELTPGTRLCAYWSQQYRCLYPGSVSEPGTPDPLLDSKFVSVEFDDGDSGRIALEDIRLLPTDYPIIEYDPNPLLSLSKRKRRTSASISTEERRTIQSTTIQQQTQHQQNNVVQIQKTLQINHQPKQLKLKDDVMEKENKDINKQDLMMLGSVDTSSSTTSTTTFLQHHREKKRMKKRKRDKLKEKILHDDNKKRKKKHKCNGPEENCKHKRHHKKHRKHKKHHHQHEKIEIDNVKIDNNGIIKNNGKINENLENIVVNLVEDNEKEKNKKNKIHVEENEEFHQILTNTENQVTLDDIMEAKAKKSKKIRDRQESCESRSKMSAFLPARQLWGWSGKGYRRPRVKGRMKKLFYKAIQRGKETIMLGDSAVFLSTGRPDRPYIGRIEAMWEACGTMVVKVKWFYHPEETVGCPLNLQYPGALFESPHVDENDVQTISHKCEVLPLNEYKEKLGDDPQRYAAIYDNNDIYYLAGYYDPTTPSLKMEAGIPFTNNNSNSSDGNGKTD